jgi:hypothetical protein
MRRARLRVRRVAEEIRRRRKHDRAAIEGQSDANLSPVLSAFHGVAY